MKHGSLFSGIGGFDLAAQWCGWENVFQVEIDKYCRRVLEKNFPNTKRYEDIKQFSGHEYKGTIDIISGGFPCQPFSVAGKQRGKSDDRYLWEEMLRVIREIKPKFVVGENVTGIIGMALDTVLFDLEAQGYSTETFIIPACGKNAWHKRDRVWIVAYTNSIGRKDEQKENGQTLHNSDRNDQVEEQTRQQQQCGISKSGSVFPNTNSFGWDNRCDNIEKRHLQTNIGITEENQQEWKRRKPWTGSVGAIFPNSDIRNRQEQRFSESISKELLAPRCDSWWETEPRVGRVVDGLPNRVDRLKGLGNAIVPQVVYEIFKAINELNEKAY